MRQAVVILAGKAGEKTRLVIQEPKSQAAKRTNDLDPATVAALPSHKDRRAFRRKSAGNGQDHDLQASTPIKAVGERLGHAKTSITLDTYAHVLPDMQDHAVDAINAALFSSAS